MLNRGAAAADAAAPAETPVLPENPKQALVHPRGSLRGFTLKHLPKTWRSSGKAAAESGLHGWPRSAKDLESLKLAPIHEDTLGTPFQSDAARLPRVVNQNPDQSLATQTPVESPLQEAVKHALNRHKERKGFDLMLERNLFGDNRAVPSLAAQIPKVTIAQHPQQNPLAIAAAG